MSKSSVVLVFRRIINNLWYVWSEIKLLNNISWIIGEGSLIKLWKGIIMFIIIENNIGFVCSFIIKVLVSN